MNKRYFSRNFLKVFLITIISFGEIIPKIMADECQILNEVFNLLDISEAIDNKLNKLNIDSPTCCNLEGIHCSTNNNGYVIDKVELRNFEIHNTDLPYVIEKLSELKALYFLSFAENNINLYLPTNLHKIKSLRTLSFRANKMIGTLPESIGDVSTLTYLDLSDNNFEGELPTSLGKLKNLNYLNLNGNKFQGTIPDSLKEIKHLKQLHLDNTELSGYVPNFPELNDCNYENTNLCVLKESKCKSTASICSDEIIKQTKEVNGYTSNSKKIIPIIIGSIVGLFIIMIILFFLYKKMSKKSKDTNDKSNRNSNSFEENINQIIDLNTNNNSKSADIIILPIVKNEDKYDIADNHTINNNNNNDIKKLMVDNHSNRNSLSVSPPTYSNMIVNGHSIVNNSRIQPVKLYGTRPNSMASSQDMNNSMNNRSSSLLSYNELYDSSGLSIEESDQLNTISPTTNTVDIVDALENPNRNDDDNNNNNAKKPLTKQEEAELFASHQNYEDDPPSY